METDAESFPFWSLGKLSAEKSICIEAGVQLYIRVACIWLPKYIPKPDLGAFSHGLLFSTANFRTLGPAKLLRLRRDVCTLAGTRP